MGGWPLTRVPHGFPAKLLCPEWVMGCGQEGPQAQYHSTGGGGGGRRDALGVRLCQERRPAVAVAPYRGECSWGSRIVERGGGVLGLLGVSSEGCCLEIGTRSLVGVDPPLWEGEEAGM